MKRFLARLFVSNVPKIEDTIKVCTGIPVEITVLGDIDSLGENQDGESPYTEAGPEDIHRQR